MNHFSMYCFTDFLDFCFLFFILLLQKSSSAVDHMYEACAPRTCGNVSIRFPFFIPGLQGSYCGYSEFGVTCDNSSSNPTIRVPENDYVIDSIYYQNQTFWVHNHAACLPQIRNVTEYEYEHLRFAETPSLHLLSNCTGQVLDVLEKYRTNPCIDEENREEWGLAMLGGDQNLNIALEKCATNVLAPVEIDGNVGSNGMVDYYEGLLRKGFVASWVGGECSECEESGGRCGFNTTSNQFRCFCPERPHRVSCRLDTGKKKSRIILGSVIGGAGLIFLALAIFLIKHRKKGIKYFRSRNLSEPISKLDIEGSRVYFGVSVFSYSELEEATNSFDASKKLGDGGFGTVYYGKLRDGREVAVKRLYEHNFNRMEQFINEIDIVTRLRHRNLATLYGCTSRRSHELLLVYEYVPNGTVADHLHGNRAKDKYLPWARRMNIAIETADALAYLHASDTIHRDVTTNNILLDDNFCVKVADFGLSRLFPNHFTHVSTGPQGTPGYIDPEYNQCFHLTNKSDVYSFGIVLVELISSMRAVDRRRCCDDINLANLAMNRIQRCAFDELIDPSLGYKSDTEVMRMTTSVAMLAFRCLQGKKEMRPTMEEALETLKEIRNDSNENVNETVNPGIPLSPELEDRGLLKTVVKFPKATNSVANVCVSRSAPAASTH